MSDKQAAVIYRRVTRSANGFAIMKKQHLSSFVAGQLRNGKRAACNHGVMDARGRLLSTKEA